jgi:predicted membrane channel-forming protein YqfA (hemolysin III family)
LLVFHFLNQLSPLWLSCLLVMSYIVGGFFYIWKIRKHFSVSGPQEGDEVRSADCNDNDR